MVYASGGREICAFLLLWNSRVLWVKSSVIMTFNELLLA